MIDLKHLREFAFSMTARQSGKSIVALIDEIEKYKKAVRSIELSVDAVKGGGSPEKALKQIKEKTRQALKGTSYE